MDIILEVRDAVATVTLNRPDKLNSITEDMKLRLPVLFGELNDDPKVRAVVLTGAGRGFCAGGDVSTMKDYTMLSSQVRLRQAHAVVMALANLDKPVIAAVRGPVAGMGWSMAMACDLTIASENAKFHQSFRRLGLAPDGGAVFFLMQTLGPATAKELVYTARPLSAPEALGHGLINRVVKDEDLEQEAQTLAVELASGPTFAFSQAKKLFRSMQLPRLETFLEGEAAAQGLVMFSRDHTEGAAAFREKRTPMFEGC